MGLSCFSGRCIEQCAGDVDCPEGQRCQQSLSGRRTCVVPQDAPTADAVDEVIVAIDGGARDVEDVATQVDSAPARDAWDVTADITAGDGGCPTGMVRIPGGTFIMGAAASDTSARADERPLHSVTLSAYCMDQTEVTVAAYRSCGTCSTPGTTIGCNWALSGVDNYPINCVDWNQASAFCSWRGARLPTEAEWEYAARGTDMRLYPWGTAPAPSCSILNYTTPSMLCIGLTTPVGMYPTGRSAFGLDDMAGNVTEWVSDWYDSRYYGTPAASSPDPPGPIISSLGVRVNRGGGWNEGAVSVRSSFRDMHDPINRIGVLGFRCARTVR